MNVRNWKKEKGAYTMSRRKVSRGWCVCVCGWEEEHFHREEAALSLSLFLSRSFSLSHTQHTTHSIFNPTPRDMKPKIRHIERRPRRKRPGCFPVAPHSDFNKRSRKRKRKTSATIRSSAIEVTVHKKVTGPPTNASGSERVSAMAPSCTTSTASSSESKMRKLLAKKKRKKEEAECCAALLLVVRVSCASIRRAAAAAR